MTTAPSTTGIEADDVRRHVTLPRWLVCGVIFAVGVVPPRALLHAQAVEDSPARRELLRGVVVDEQTRQPLAAVLVTLIDPEGLELTRYLVGPDGIFRFQLPGPEEYSVRAERLGTRTSTLEGVRVGPGETVSVRIAMSLDPVTLTGIQVTGESRCELARDAGADVQRVWEETRKVLRAQSFTQAEGWYRYDLVKHTRQLDPRSLAIKSESSVRHHTTNQRPIASRSVDLLQEHGYVVQSEDGYWSYFAPDADVLLSDEFLATHCLSIRAGFGEEEGLVGLAFRPQSHRGRSTDIEGVLWLERETARLRWLDFRYRNLPDAAGEVDSEHVGGRVEFRGFEDGTWIVSSWRIRMPVVEEVSLGSFGGRRLRLAGIVEEGGRVAKAWRPGSDAVAFSDSDQLGAIEGKIVGDGLVSDLGSVLVVGTGFTAEVTETGHFRIEDLPPGRYRLAYVRAEMFGLDAAIVDSEVEVSPGATATVTMRPTSKDAVLAEICEQDEWRPGTAILVGEVLDPRTGVAVAEAQVSAEWQLIRDLQLSGSVLVDLSEQSITTKTNEVGAFRICGVPTDLELSVSVRIGDAHPTVQRVVIPNAQPVMVLLIDSGGVS